MVKFRKGEIKFLKTMNPIEISDYLKSFPENEEYVIKFLEKHEYNWVKKVWKKGRTI